MINKINEEERNFWWWWCVMNLIESHTSHTHTRVQREYKC